MKRANRSNRRFSAILALVLSVSCVGWLAAQELAKEYIYVGGRLIAVEVATSPSGGPTIALDVAPPPTGSTVTMGSGASITITATDGAGNNLSGVSWTTIPAATGGFDNSSGNPVVYTAPVVTGSTPVTIQAAFGGSSNSIDVDVEPFVVQITNLPAGNTITDGTSHQFGIQASGTPSSQSWTEDLCSPGSCIDQTGLFTPPGDLCSIQSVTIGVTVNGGEAADSTTVFVEPMTPLPGNCAEDPAMQVTSFVIAPDDLVHQGEQLTASFTVQINEQVSGAVADFYLSQDATVGTSPETFLGSSSLGTLHSPVTSFDRLVAIPIDSITGGNLRILLFVHDLATGLPGLPCTENTACSGDIEVAVSPTGEGAPDIFPVINSTAAVFTTSEILQVQMIVRNVGSAAIPGNFFNWLRVNDVNKKSWEQDGLAVQGVGFCDANDGCPNNFFPLGGVHFPTPGDYTVALHADTEPERVEEVDEDNNARSLAVTVVAPSDPDLRVTSFSVPPVVNLGDVLAMDATILNDGTASAGTFDVGFYVSDDDEITRADLRLGGCQIAGLAASQSDNCPTPVNVNIPGALTPGQYFLGVLADDSGGFGDVAEDQEDNNQADIEVDLNATPVALGVSPFSGTGSSVALAASYSDADTSAELASMFLLIDSDSSEAGGCYVEYRSATDDFHLFDDGGAAVAGTVTAGSGSAQNSQCKLSGAGASVVNVGLNQKDVTFPIEFLTGFEGAKQIYLHATDSHGATTSWIQRGNWTVTTGPPPVGDAVDITSPTAGQSFGSAAIPLAYTTNVAGLDHCEVELNGSGSPIPYSSCAPLTLSYVHLQDAAMVLAYDFAEAVSGTAFDRAVDDAENNDSEIFNAGVATDATHYGAHVSFNGTTDEIEPLSQSGSVLNAAFSARTFEAWIRPNDVTATQTIYEEGGQTHGMYLGITQGNLRLTMQANNDIDRIETPIAVTGSWRHVAAVYDGAAMAYRLYLDGQLANSDSTAYSTVPAHSDDPGIGRTIGGGDADNVSGSGRSFNGSIDEVAIYSRSLTGPEILSHFDKSYLSDAQSLVVRAFDATAVQGSDSVAFTVGVSGGPQVTINTPVGGATLPAANVAIGYTATPGSEALTRCDLEVNSGPAMAYPTCPAVVLSHSHLTNADKFLAYDFAEGATGTAHDRAADTEDNSGTVHGGPSAAVSQHHGTALSFDGVDDWVSPISPGSGPLHSSFSTRSFEAWFKADNTSNPQTLFEQGGNWHGFYVGITGGNLRFSTQSANGGPKSINHAFTDTTSWHHVAAVFDNGTMRLYLDGVQVENSLPTGFTSVNSAQDDPGIGATDNLNADDASGAQFFSGDLDEIAVYTDALTAAEIADHAANDYLSGATTVRVTAFDAVAASDFDEVSFTVTSGGGSCSYSLAPSAQAASSAGESLSATLTTQTGCAVSASDDVSWITITGSPGTGSGPVNYTVDKNTTAAPRPGTITVNGETLVVTQGANQVPSFGTPPNPSHNEGAAVNFSVTASDPESDILTYSIASGTLPAGVSLNAGTGAFTGTIDTGASLNSPYTLTVAANDGVNPAVNAPAFTWTISTGSNPPPTVSITSPADGSSHTGAAIPLTYSVTDNDLVDCDLQLNGGTAIKYDAPCADTVLSYVHLTDSSKIVAFDFADGVSSPADDRAVDAEVNDATLTGVTVAGAPGDHAPALHLDGTDSISPTAPGGGFFRAPFTDRTFEAWIKADSTTGSYTIYDEGGATHGMYVGILNGVLRAVAQASNVVAAATTPFTNTIDWTHVAAVFDGDGATGTVRLYVDGVEVDSIASSFGTVPSHTDDPGIGRTLGNGDADNNGSGFTFLGDIDEVAIYNRALTANEIADHADNEYLSGTGNTVTITANDAIQSASDSSTFTVTNGIPSVVGIIELEAEDGTIVNRTHSWTLETAVTDYSGSGYLNATPNSGLNQNTGYVGVSPEVQFSVDFPAAGTYYVWVRGHADGGGDDSIHLGLDGAAVGTADRVSVFDHGSGGWTWSGHAMSSEGRIEITVASAGTHTINAWMREDGFRFDKIAVADSASLQPSWATSNGHFGVEVELGAIQNGARRWDFLTNHTGYSGEGFLQALDDVGTTNHGAGGTPHVTFNVDFKTTGTYYVWVRGTSISSGNSAWVEINGGGDRNIQFSTSGFSWSNDHDVDPGGSTPPIPAEINVTTTGVKTLRISMREDGTRIDRIIVTQDPAYVP